MPFGKWKDFEDCVRDFVSQGKDEESARKLCGYLQARLGTESFSWVGDLSQHGRDLVRGKALHPIKTVHPEEWPNVRVYLEDELKRAADTLVGKPLLLDHLYPINGKIVATKYEDGAIEYLAELADEHVLRWIKDGTIKHCSVEYDWNSLTKVDGVAPRGIRFTGLALLKDFEPGDPMSSVEVWESIIRLLKETKGNLFTASYRVSPTSPSPRSFTQGSEMEDQEDEREKLRRAQLERSKRYGISPKEDGHLTKPEEYRDITDEEFADPVNYRYPIDADHVRAALAYFNQADNRQAGGYSHDESVKIMSRIINAALDNGVQVSYQPDDPVYRDLPEEVKKRLSGYEDEKEIESLESQIALLKHQKKTLLKEIDELSKQLGQAVIEPQRRQEDLRETVLRELKAVIFERIPHRWGYGPFEQNRRIKELIRRLEQS